MSAVRLNANSGVSSWALTGAIMGLLAGVVFIIFEIVVAGVIPGAPPAFGPLRLISAIVLGQGTLPPPPVAALPTAIIVGLIVHFILAAIFGLTFGAILSFIGSLAANRMLLIAAATVGGLLLWIVNFFVIAPIAFPWFGMANNVVQFFAHTFFFGTALGLLLAGRLGE